MPVNKIFPAINLVFVLTIVLLISLSVRIWTHPPYPSRVDGASQSDSPKNLQKLDLSKPGYNAGMVSQVVKSNLFRKQRQQYIPPVPIKVAPAPTSAPKPVLPPPNLTLRGVLLLGGMKIAILEGKYSVFEGTKIVQKKLKKKGYPLGHIVGEFELTVVEKGSAMMDDKKGRKILLKVTKRSAEKVVQRGGNSLSHKSKNFNPAKFVRPKVRKKVTKAKKTKVNRAKPAQAPPMRISGASSRPPPRVHISGR